MYLRVISNSPIFQGSFLTRISLPVKVVLRVAMTLEVQSGLLASRAVGERHVVVGNIIEEMDFFLLQEETSCNGVDRSITPSFVEKSTIFVESVKVIGVCL
jgi:hypothetical protein